MSEVVLCKTGLARHAPDLSERMADTLSTVDCFDKCEVCERWLIARIDGITTRFRTADELLEALDALR